MKKEQAEEIAQGFINQLRQGNVPWRKPWSADGTVPSNYYSKRPYRGINTLILGLTVAEKGYQSPYWTTYKAAFERGAQVRKGEKSTKIVFWKPFEKVDDSTGEKSKFLVARLYSVFNTDQIDGIDWHPIEREPVEVPDALKLVMEGYQNPPTITHAPSDRAFYRPSDDSITLPLLEQFTDTQGYAETVLHEIVHSTGHPKRCNRFEGGAIGHRQDYAKEELVAEIGASMLMQHAGIPVDMPQMGAYVQSWLRALEDDHSLIIKAAQAAQKGVDLITGYTYQEDQQEEDSNEQGNVDE